MDKMLFQQGEEEDDKENQIDNCSRVRMSLKADDTWLIEERNMAPWQRSSDESFEALEKMCDKTASDPNSTLFQYIHSEHQEQVLAHAKKRSLEGDAELNCARGYDAEALALQRLLDDLRVEEQQQLENESPLKGVDITQLDDIEAPSRLWENTISGEAMIQTSPLKMVGLLRPSTILEENADESVSCYSDRSSRVSFHSALRGVDAILTVPSETSSSCYETAHESTSTSCASNKAYDIVKSPQGNETPVIQTKFSEANDNFNLLELSTDLIDLDNTIAPTHSFSHILQDNSEMKKKFESFTESLEESVIEIFSDEESIPLSALEISAGAHIKEENCVSSTAASNPNMSVDPSNISSASVSYTAEKDFSNKGDASGAENSPHFDDTMEEVDYMLQKGLEYMAAAKESKIPLDKVDMLAIQPTRQMLETRNTVLISPTRKQKQKDSPKKSHKFTSPKSPVKVACSSPRSKIANRFALNIKPMPKFDAFKKPSGIPTSASMRHKEVANKQFSHIVSPIGAYMKKTGTTPLMATIKTRTKHADVHNSSAFRALEYESRLYQPKFDGHTEDAGGASPVKLPGVLATARTLPKKAYISSEFKHIVDERTPVTIPGGKKIQKYLESAMLPAVVRHEGKLKMSEKTGAITKLPANVQKNMSTDADPQHMARRTNLGDLSVMSGDVSVYTIMDAQKF